MVSQHYLRTVCKCGRSLRSRVDQAGTEISCWDCHASVKVPIPVAPGPWVSRLLRAGARQLFDATTCSFLAVGAGLVTMALLIPGQGVAGAAVALALVMIGYGELLRRGSQGDWTPRPKVRLAARLWRVLLCLGAGGALVLPLIFASGTKSAPRVTLPGLAIGLPLVAGLPLLMLATYGLRGSIGARLAQVGAMVRRHPVAVVATLMLLPLSIVAIEGILFVTTRLMEVFAFMVLDLLPPLPQVKSTYGIPYIRNVDYRSLADPTLLDFYARAVARGHSLIGAIPASLALETSNGYNLIAIYTDAKSYHSLRILFTAGIAAGMLAALAIQARWLGLLSTMDARKTAAEPVPPEASQDYGPVGSLSLPPPRT